MSNKFKPHVYVIPEDDADRQIANGFIGHHRVKDNCIQIMSPPGGWTKVLKVFELEYISVLRSYQCAHVVMVIDFDTLVESRRGIFLESIPEDIAPRTFLLGVRNKPEPFKTALGLGGLTKIGEALARECDTGEATLWQHEDLAHNDAERLRMIDTIRRFLF